LPDLTTVVVIGGSGHFGARICRRIVSEPNTELVIAGRREANATELVHELRARCPGATIRAARLDQYSESFENDLRQLHPGIVIHTAGPYQGQDYRVAKACIHCGCHYVDLADGREFVAGISDLHGAALERDLLLVSGASTLPGLSSAVIDSVRDRFQHISAVHISIAPGHQTPRGPSTIAAVLSYCGKPFQVLVGGQWKKTYGWQDLRVERYPDLGRRLAGACDVPDLSLFPSYVAGIETVTFHAALEAPWEQLALWLMAWITRIGLIEDWTRFLPTFQWLSNRLIALGSDTGGMQVRLIGTDSNHNSKICTWDLTARNNYGPEIPCTPALIIARKLVRNAMPERGAYACLGLVSLTDMEESLRELDISWRVVD